MKSDAWEIIVGIIFGLLVAVGLLICFGCFLDSCGNKSTTNEYALSELDGGVYGIHVVSTSAIPAQNYEMVTVNISGQIYTIKGNVNIHYITSGEPRIVWVNKNYVNNDIADLYVPEGSIRFDGTVTVH